MGQISTTGNEHKTNSRSHHIIHMWLPCEILSDYVKWAAKNHTIHFQNEKRATILSNICIK